MEREKDKSVSEVGLLCNDARRLCVPAGGHEGGRHDDVSGAKTGRGCRPHVCCQASSRGLNGCRQRKGRRPSSCAR